MKKTTKKLMLLKETVKNLEKQEELAVVRGGSAISCYSACFDTPIPKQTSHCL